MPNRQSITKYALNADGETNFPFYHLTFAEAIGEGQLVGRFERTVLEE